MDVCMKNSNMDDCITRVGSLERTDSFGTLLFLCGTSLGIPFASYIRGSLITTGILSRLVLSDFFIVALIVVALFSRRTTFCVTWDIVLMAMIAFGITLSSLARDEHTFQEYTFLSEAIIHWYLFLFYFVLRNVLMNSFWRKVFVKSLCVAFVLSVITEVCRILYPCELLPGTSVQPQASFLNYGQYGAFLSVTASPFFATWFAGHRVSQPPMDEPRSVAYEWTRSLICISCFVLLYLSGKRSALVGTTIGVSLCLFYLVTTMALSVRKLALITSVVFVIGVLVTFTEILATTELLGGADPFQRVISLWWFIDGSQQSEFIEQNWGSAISVFLEKPFLGMGYGGGLYFEGEWYEVHSTYLKWLGEGGIAVGLPGFLLMIGIFLHLVKAARTSRGYVRLRSLMLLFMFMGLGVGMFYHYYPRNRDFVAVLALMMCLTQRAHVIRNMTA